LDRVNGIRDDLLSWQQKTKLAAVKPVKVVRRGEHEGEINSVPLDELRVALGQRLRYLIAYVKYWRSDGIGFAKSADPIVEPEHPWPRQREKMPEKFSVLFPEKIEQNLQIEVLELPKSNASKAAKLGAAAIAAIVARLNEKGVWWMCMRNCGFDGVANLDADAKEMEEEKKKAKEEEKKRNARRRKVVPMEVDDGGPQPMDVSARMLWRSTNNVAATHWRVGAKEITLVPAWAPSNLSKSFPTLSVVSSRNL
jgi:hypothetical protein